MIEGEASLSYFEAVSFFFSLIMKEKKFLTRVFLLSVFSLICSPKSSLVTVQKNHTHTHKTKTKNSAWICLALLRFYLKIWMALAGPMETCSSVGDKSTPHRWHRTTVPGRPALWAARWRCPRLGPFVHPAFSVCSEPGGTRLGYRHRYQAVQPSRALVREKGKPFKGWHALTG